jgi:hypothetical protein
MRELGACFAVSKSTAHRIVSIMTPQLAALAARQRLHDRRASWVVDGTLIRRRDLQIITTTPAAPESSTRSLV